MSGYYEDEPALPEPDYDAIHDFIAPTGQFGDHQVWWE